MRTEKNEDVFSLSWYSFDKKIPDNYDNLVIPEILRITKNIKGDVIKNKIYNYLVYYYNRGLTKGVLDSIYIYTATGTKKIYYDIKQNEITLELIPEVNNETEK